MAQLPRFFFDGPLTENKTVALDADTSRHIWQVLRMQPGERILLTDGRGAEAEGAIYTAERHQCNVALEKTTLVPRSGKELHLCVSFTKNNSRNEWLLEKAAEIGVASIIPLVTARSEKTHIRADRWTKILQSAILQSQQSYLPALSDPLPLHKVHHYFPEAYHRYIAHCVADLPRTPISKLLKREGPSVLLIGPEGDFTLDEVNLCTGQGFIPILLGNTRLRTETAAIAATICFNLLHDD